MKIIPWIFLIPALFHLSTRNLADGHTPAGEPSLNVEKGDEEAIIGEVLSGVGNVVLEGILEVTKNSAEEEMNCDAKMLSCDSQTLSQSDWEALENGRMSCKASSCRSGKAKTNQAKSPTKVDSEPECRTDDGAPGSGLSNCLCRGCSYAAWDSLLGALEETLPAPDQWPQTVIGDPKMPTLALLEQDYQKPAVQPRSDLCGSETRVVIGVFSQATNFWARQVSRVSWASAGETVPQGVCVVYILAQPHTQHQVLNVRRMIEEESARWGDLLQIQAPESYSLLAIKSLAFLSWTQRILPQVPYLVKTDDDVVYSLENLHKTIASHPNLTKDPTIACNYFLGFPVDHTNISAKHFVPWMEYPKPAFPDYCSGVFYIMSGKTRNKLLDTFETTNKHFVRLDDIFITGILAETAGIVRTHLPQIYDHDQGNCDMYRDASMMLHHNTLASHISSACSVSWGKGEKASRPELEALKQRLWVYRHRRRKEYNWSSHLNF